MLNTPTRSVSPAPTRSVSPTPTRSVSLTPTRTCSLRCSVDNVLSLCCWIWPELLCDVYILWTDLTFLWSGGHRCAEERRLLLRKTLLVLCDCISDSNSEISLSVCTLLLILVISISYTVLPSNKIWVGRVWCSVLYWAKLNKRREYFWCHIEKPRCSRLLFSLPESVRQYPERRRRHQDAPHNIGVRSVGLLNKTMPRLCLWTAIHSSSGR